MFPDDIGVVVIGRNEGGRLIECIKSIKLKTNTIVYVDSGSTDGSVIAAVRLGVFVVNLDLTRPFTAARARNEGFATLRRLKPDMRFVQFVDGDCSLAQGWLDTAVAFIKERNDVALVSGRLRERYPTASVYNQLCDFEWDTPIGEALECGGNALARVEAFEAVGGFSPQLIAGEEPELCLRLREKAWKIWRLDAEMGQHDAAITRFTQWWLRAVRYGYALAEVPQLHRTSHLGIWRREKMRTIFWGGVLPLVICLGALIHPAAVSGILAYFIQLCRIALARGPTSRWSWILAVFSMIGKFAAFQGTLKFYWGQFHHTPAELIEYK
jgi:GT2 family glycosyltransferase